MATLLKIIANDTGHDIVCSVKRPVSHDLVSHSYISRVTFSVNNDTITRLDLGPMISRDPLFGIHQASLESGDVVKVVWVDTEGNRGAARARVG